MYPLFGETLEYADLPELGTAVYGLSYHSREIREPRYDGITPGRAEPIEILLAHGGDQNHIPIDMRALASSGFDYIALGHIHKPQASGEGSGSFMPERWSPWTGTIRDRTAISEERSQSLGSGPSGSHARAGSMYTWSFR